MTYIMFNFRKRPQPFPRREGPPQGQPDDGLRRDVEQQQQSQRQHVLQQRKFAFPVIC